MTLEPTTALLHPDRLAALRDLAILDTPPEDAFDRLTRLATALLHAPVALVSLVDPDRQFLKSCVGLPDPWASQRETPLSHSFCQHAVASQAPLIIDDAREHPLVRDNLAIPDLSVIAYAGIPLIVGGQALGSFCVIDTEPRCWTEAEIAVLTDLAAAAMTELELRRTSQVVVRQAQALAALLESTGEGVFGLDRDGRCTFANRAGAALLARRQDELVRWSLRALIHPRCESPVCLGEAGCPLPVELVQEQTTHVEDVMLSRRDGTTFPAAITSAPIIEDGVVTGAVVTVQDITERKRAREALERSKDELERRVQERTAALSDANVRLHSELGERRRAEKALRDREAELADAQRIASLGSWSVDLDTRVMSWSDELYRIFGYPPKAFVPTLEALLAAVHPQDRALVRSSIDTLRTHGIEYRILRPDGQVRVVHDRYDAVPDDNGRPVRLVGSVHDITERKALEDQVRHQALHDALTHLPNRTLLVDRMNQSLARAMRNQRGLAVLVLDLDRFKVINDGLGHAAGDRVLVAVARRLKACLRPADTVARLGGNAFALLLEDVGDLAEALGVVERVQAQMQPPFPVDGREVFVTASIGVAYLPASQQVGPDDVLQEANLALYRAKRKGRAQHAVFDTGQRVPALEHLELETALRRAVERGELRVYYQPIVELETGRIAEVEALVRWQHPRQGLVSPATFIPLAEETGLILPIGRWVLEEACRQVQRWQQLPGTPPLTLSVNLSARQFRHPELAADIARTLTDLGFPPCRLKLEITESVAMQEADTAIATLRELKQLGVKLAIDDFGTGYSSLAYLKRFPIDTLKIDRSFVNGLGQNVEDVAIVRAIVTLGKTLKLGVTAEGIETAEQRAQLEALDCDLGQGYYFARPLPPDDCLALLQAQAEVVPTPAP